MEDYKYDTLDEFYDALNQYTYSAYDSNYIRDEIIAKTNPEALKEYIDINANIPAENSSFEYQNVKIYLENNNSFPMSTISEDKNLEKAAYYAINHEATKYSGSRRDSSNYEEMKSGAAVGQAVSQSSQQVANESGEASNEKDAENNKSNPTIFPNYYKIENDKSGYYYDKDDVDDLRGDINHIIDDNISKLLKNISYAESSILANLCEETKNNISIGTLMDDVRSQVRSIGSSLQNIEDNVELVSKKMQNKNSRHSGTSSHGVLTINSNPQENITSDTTSSENSQINDTTVSTDNGEVTDLTDSVQDNTAINEVTGQNNENLNDNLNKAILGTITFTEIVPLFEKLDSESTIVNSNPTSSYELSGIEKYNGKYYFKIKDSNDNKSYYAEVNDKVKLESDITDVLEVKNTTVKIDTPDLNNDNNFAEVLNENDVFLVTGKETYNGEQTVELAQVYDSQNGKDCYIIMNDKVEIKSLESLISARS